MRARMVRGGVLAGLLLLPWVRVALEASMALHMLVQIPLFVVAGAWLASAREHGDRASSRWSAVNVGGVPGLLLASSVITAWMIPRALDLAATHLLVDLFKVATLLIAGACLRHSWSAAGSITQAFVLGNLAWMAAVVGLLLRDAPIRVCTSYLESDQVVAGTGLLLLAAVAGVRWLLAVAFPVRNAALPRAVYGASRTAR
jgi:hypothetical protein